MDLLSCLTALTKSDVEAVAANRPEAASLRGRAASERARLAARVAQPFAIAQATRRLDRFHLQLLQLTCALGGRLGRELAAEQGVPADAIGPAARELARRALAFPEPGGRGLVVPPEVQAAVSCRGTIGPTLRPLLEAETVEELKRIAAAIGVSASRKAALVEGIHAWLSDPETVRSLLRVAPPRSRRALAAIQEAGGEVGFHDLAEELGPDVHQFRHRWQRRAEKDESGLVWLWIRGLVFRDTWEARIFVPAPVTLAIRERAFPVWDTEAPAPELAPALFDRDPQTLVEEVSRLLRAVAQSPMSLLKSGEIGVKECRRVAIELGLEEQPVRWFLGLAWRAGLLVTRAEPPPAGRRGRRDPSDEPHSLTVGADGERWLTAGLAEAWLAIFDCWHRAVDDPGREILRAIAALPAGQGATEASLGRLLSWRMPAVWPDDESGIRAVAALRSDLAALGVCPASSGIVALSEPGRTALDGGGAAAVALALPAGTESCTVQADMTVVVAGQPSAELAGGLARFADLESSGAARVYRLSERTVVRALDQGMAAGEIEDFLASRSWCELPGPVRELVRDVGRRHGRLRVGVADVYITGEDASLLAEALASGRVRGLTPRLLAPTVAVVEGRTREQVLDALRRSGLMPAVEPGANVPGARPASGARQRRGPVTDPEVLARRHRALERAREAGRARLGRNAERP